MIHRQKSRSSTTPAADPLRSSVIPASQSSNNDHIDDQAPYNQAAVAPPVERDSGHQDFDTGMSDAESDSTYLPSDDEYSDGEIESTEDLGTDMPHAKSNSTSVPAMMNGATARLNKTIGIHIIILFTRLCRISKRLVDRGHTRFRKPI